jgi:predicted transcriptional regulator of viral defense system
VHINWQNQATGNGTITITDVAGREVYRSSLNINTVSGEQTISLDKLNSGIYIINVKSEGVNYNEKLMLNK